MLKGFEGLHGLARDVQGQDPVSGQISLFANTARTRPKILFRDGSGLWVCAKRLEKGRFRWPSGAEPDQPVKLRAEELSMLLNGMDLAQARQRPGWHRKVS